jgi:short-subunit dehydrogenase
MMVLDNILILLGLYFLLPKLRLVLTYLGKIKQRIQSSGNLKEKFGKDGWVVVTGCTAGIGEQIAYRLAEQGFKLILIGRSIEKLRNVQAKCKNVETIIIQADLCKQAMEMEMYERIRKECEDIEICMLINNAGVLYNGFFKDQTPQQIRE